MQGNQRPLPRRKSIRLKDYDYSQPGYYFITGCVLGRQCLFGSVVGDAVELNAVGEIVSKEWHDLPRRFPSVGLDAFVVMPNHVHGIIILRGREAESTPTTRKRPLTLGQVTRAFKSLSAVHVNALLGRHGPLWQRLFHDHITRDDWDLNRIREYIQNNPASWALDLENPDCKEPSDIEKWIRGLRREPPDEPRR